MHQCFTSFFMYLVREVEVEIYYGEMVSSCLWISIHKQMYSGPKEALGKIHNCLSCECEQCKNGSVLGFATGPHLNVSERLPISSNHDENYYRWLQMLN
jgi:hypothetical protein